MEQFLSLLRENSVTAIADVRSQPYSKFNQAFNGNTLKETLRDAGILYVFMGQELGARTGDPKCYVGGKVQYELLAATPLFQSGLERVDKGRANHRIALMCAEKEPIECHRCILVARHLQARGIKVRHILDEALVEDHDVTAARLAESLALSKVYGSRQHDELLSMAYSIQGERIAFTQEAKESVQYDLWI
jgi:uncharacterized protein (DUF488 family)